MTIAQIFGLINSVADNQPNINHIVKSGNIYDLNEEKNIQYAAFCISQQEHREADGFFYFRAYLYYVDREKADGSNKIDIQSTACQTLSNIVNTLIQKHFIDFEGDITYRVFEESFGSLCAGAYASITIALPVGDCYEEF